MCRRRSRSAEGGKGKRFCSMGYRNKTHATGDFRQGSGVAIGRLGTPVQLLTVLRVVPANEAIKGCLIVVWPTLVVVGKPGVEFRLDGVGIPYGEVAPDARQRLVRQLGAEQRHGLPPLGSRLCLGGLCRRAATWLPLRMRCGATAHANRRLLAGREFQTEIKAGQVIVPDEGLHFELEAAIGAFRTRFLE